MFSPISPSRRDRKKKGDDYSIVIRDINSRFSVIVRIIYIQRSMNGTNAFLASYAIEYGEHDTPFWMVDLKENFPVIRIVRVYKSRLEKTL